MTDKERKKYQAEIAKLKSELLSCVNLLQDYADEFRHNVVVTIDNVSDVLDEMLR